MEAGYDGATEVYKSDQRSRVWRVEVEGVSFVVKRFDFAPWRQRLGLLTGRHPASIEWRSNVMLHDAGVPVVPIEDGGTEPAGIGCRVWLATRHAGRSLQRLLRECDVEADRQAAIEAAARLARRVIDRGFNFKDLKPSNIVIDGPTARLIDVGAARRGADPARVGRMLGVMDRVMIRDGVDAATRERFRTLVGCR